MFCSEMEPRHLACRDQWHPQSGLGRIGAGDCEQAELRGTLLHVLVDQHRLASADQVAIHTPIEERMWLYNKNS